MLIQQLVSQEEGTVLNPFKRFRVDYLLFGGFATFIIILLSVITFVNYSLTFWEIANRTSIYQLELLGELSKQLGFQDEIS